MMITQLGTMDTIDTISQLLQTSDSQYRLYDIGRIVTKLSKTEFEKVEQNQLPYPYPMQGHACIAIAFWQKKSQQPYLWLLKLPLDERGLLNQGARNHFIAIIVEALGKNLTQETNDNQEALLKSNPYLYTPAQYKLASLNSKIKRELKLAHNEHLTVFSRYLSDDCEWQSWQHIGVQGITDFVVNLDASNKDNKITNSELLVNSIEHLPQEVLFPLCAALENEKLPVNLIDALIHVFHHTDLISNSNEKKDLIQQQLLRSLASNCQHPHVVALIQKLLSSQTVTVELLITLAGRCWLALTSKTTLMHFFEQVAQHNDQPLFDSLFKDLVALPTLRPVVFECIRTHERSELLSKAIGQLFHQT